MEPTGHYQLCAFNFHSYELPIDIEVNIEFADEVRTKEHLEQLKYVNSTS